VSKTALITGVHTGLGLGLAESFLDSGWRVFGTSRREPAALAGRDGFSFLSLDLSDLGAIAPAISGFLAGDAALDLVVLNAGMLGGIKPWSEHSSEDIRRLMDVNVWANKELIEALSAGGRSVKQVVGISSGAAVNCSGGWGPYSVSKAALNALMKTYAEEKPDTHFSALAPGVIKTAMVQGILDLEDDGRFTATKRVQSLKGTPNLQTVDGAVERLRRAFEKLLDEESGAFLDIRKMDL
jgi:NAD(P)-dependent dehydrogenase (short-subunit alcohol dehydrogenase family)